MKTILWMVLFMGCASSQYSASNYQDLQVLFEYIRDHPEFYEKMKQERP